MNAEELSKRYIKATEKTLKFVHKTESRFEIKEINIDEVLNYVNSYLKDAKYFLSEQKFETSLTSIAYCEGLLDALKILGTIRVEKV